MNQEYAASLTITQQPTATSFGKTTLDVAGGIMGSLVFVFLYPIIGALIKLDSQGPVLVRLERVSAGKTIRLYKFRSMKHNAHLHKESLRKHNERADGPFFKMSHDPRITQIGKIIRKFRLDEIPQCLNVLRGELSLVGPRPHEPAEVAQYPEAYKHIIFEKAGITGLSQVSGASSLPYLKELELDSAYVKNRSLWLDCKIIAKTAAIMLFDPTAV